MHTTLTTIQGQLSKVIAQIQASVPNDEPLGVAHGHWGLPGLSRSELIAEAQSIVDLIESRGGDSLGTSEALLNDYVRRLEHLRAQTVGQFWGGNGGNAVSAYLQTLDALRKALAPVLADEHADSVVKLRKLAAQLRSMEATLKGLEPRTTSLGKMVERIEQAYNAADQLPTDIESLTEARQKIEELARDATKDQVRLVGIREGAERQDEELKGISAEAAAVLKRCEQAYSASTSVGLAAAFSERSDTLSKSMWVWVAGLVIALLIGSVFGSTQLHSLTELFKAPDAAPSVIVLNLFMSLLSVAAPVWFAWLATKQVGQRFRLAEDYAFKASISRAYEGYRQEAHRIDEELEARLLASALTRLDELPLRLVEPDSHGSPWHELASSDIVKEAVRAVPGFADQVKALASKAISTLTPTRAKQTESPIAEDGSQ